MINALIRDAYVLGDKINDYSSPREKKIIVNLAISHYAAFKPRNFPEIISCYGYRSEKTPKFLQEEGVIEKMFENIWFTGVSDVKSEIKVGGITRLAREKDYIGKNQRVDIYLKIINRKEVDRGPKYIGQCLALVNLVILRRFLRRYAEFSPRIEDKWFRFLGEKVEFKGEDERKCVSLLIDNLNSRVTYQEFYDVRGDSDYKNWLKRGDRKKQLKDANEANKTMFKEIRKKIEANPIFQKAFVLVQRDGFGMFIDTKYFPSPEKQ